MKNLRILVISSANIDFVQRMRRVPYAGETIVEDGMSYAYYPGGKGGNSAVAFARFGADTVFACKLGRDTNAKRLAAIYKKEGINTHHATVDAEAGTGLASILTEENGKNRIIVYPGANGKITAGARSIARQAIHDGVSTKQIDRIVHEYITKNGAYPTFLNYNGFPGSACIPSFVCNWFC